MQHDSQPVNKRQQEAVAQHRGVEAVHQENERRQQRNIRDYATTSWQTRGKLEGRDQQTGCGRASRGQEAAAAQQEVLQQPAGKQKAKGGEAPADKEATVS